MPSRTAFAHQMQSAIAAKSGQTHEIITVEQLTHHDLTEQKRVCDVLSDLRVVIQGR